MRPDRAEDFEIKAGELGERGARVTAVSISLKGVSKRYRTGPGVHDVSLEARRGEILALVGPSGSGKTTLLRLIAGLESADAGTVLFDDEDMTNAPPAARRVGFVFQHYALFRHMSVFKNVAFGLDVKPRAERPAAAERARIVQSLLDLVGLPDLGARRPAQLSGGQRQRVALARALAVSPRLLLLDEPFGALDVLVRKTLRRELRRIHAATGVTTVFVTHDQEEALELADQIIVLNNGRIEQAGSPLDVLATPATAFVAGFLGEANAIPGKVVQGVFHGLGGRLDAPGVKDGPATAYVRPENLVLAGGDEPSVESRLLRVAPRAGSVFLECAAPEGLTLEALAPASHVVAAFRIGDVVRLALRRGHVFTTAL